MNTVEVIEMFRSAIANTRQTGTTQVTLDDLDGYAKFLEETAAKTPTNVAAGDAAMERYKADLAIWIGARQQRHEYNLEMLRATIATGQAALKSALLINGGAAAALLAFLDSTWPGRNTQHAISLVSTALLLYVLGVLSAALAAGATYFSQAGYGQEFGKASMPIGRFGHVAAILATVMSYIFLVARRGWHSLASIVANSRHRLGAVPHSINKHERFDHRRDTLALPAPLCHGMPVKLNVMSLE